MILDVEEILTSIKNKLMDEKNLRKLVYYNEKDALEKEIPSKKDVEELFITYPLITEDNKRTCFIAINYDGTPNLDWNLKQSNNIIKISCVCHRDLWELNNNKIRTLQMANIISEQVQNESFGSIGKMILTSIIQVYYTPEIVGYALIYSYVDSTGDDISEF